MEIAINGKYGAGKVLLIDEEDVALLQGKSVYMHGSAKSRGGMYPTISLNGRNMFVHKVIAESMRLRGEIDHKNRNKCDARRCNLREATRGQNIRNRGLRVSNKSGLKGVSWRKDSGKWASYIRVNRHAQHLGLFTCQFEAARAYDRRALEIDPIHAETNFSLGLLPESPNLLPQEA